MPHAVSLERPISVASFAAERGRPGVPNAGRLARSASAWVAI